jgi:hypothetical protein
VPGQGAELDHAAQAAALGQAHRQVRQALLLAGVEHRQHMRMVELREQPRLAYEPLLEPRIVVDRDHLERDAPPQPFVHGLVDDPDASSGDAPHDAVTGEDLPRLEFGHHLRLPRERPRPLSPTDRPLRIGKGSPTAGMR